MKKALNVVIMIAAMTALTASSGLAEEKEKKPELKAQTTCPVMGGKIIKSSYVDHEGQRVYFCCAGCETAFKKDPDTYIKKMAANGEKPATLQTTCPVMGGKINKNSYADHNGLRVYFCCAGCDTAFKKNPEKYVKKMQADGIVLDAVPEQDDKK